MVLSRGVSTQAEVQALHRPCATPPGSRVGYTRLYLDRLLLFKGTRTEAAVAATLSSEGAVTEATVG